MFKKTLIALVLIAFSFQSAFAFFGARPLGMGSAFTAVADDANAPYWNPAGLALNPEVSLTGSTLLNNRNTYVGDNVANLKLCYETEMNPFQWIAGVGIASLFALEGAKYLHDQGILKKGWGRPGETTKREESMAEQVKGSEEVVGLRQEAKEALKKAAGGFLSGTEQAAKTVARETVRGSVRASILPYYSPWYYPDYYHPRYWERVEVVEAAPATKAQFALGLSWLNDNNFTLDQNTNWYSLTLASGFEQRVAVGGNINFYNLQKISTGIRGIGADLDLGVIAKPVDYISVGLATKGILTTDIKWQDNSSTRYEMLVNAGLAVKPLSSLTLAADVHNIFRRDQTYHYGAEAVLLPELLVRAGLDNNNKTAGLSLAVGNLIIDYAILGGTYNRTQMVGGTWRF
ncbi:MAG: hypothetical protein PHG97_02225 [Candidatus Margulisbacteria bacterium]|nr:hypothetical protein [Candidatus Margulisiibacteriota bacterium]